MNALSKILLFFLGLMAMSEDKKRREKVPPNRTLH